MSGSGAIYHHATGTFGSTLEDGDAAGLAAAKTACAAGGLIQMGPGTEGITLGVGWGTIALARIDALGRMFGSRWNITDGDDPTKVQAWDVSAISTGTTRTVVAPNYGGLLLLPASLGNAGEFLRSGGAGVQPAFAALPSVTNALLDAANHTDTVAQAVTRGSLIYGNSTPKWDELVIGAANTVLTSDGTDVAWSLNPAVQHDALAHLKPIAIAACSWSNTSLIITSANLPGAVKVGDYVLLGDQSRTGCQGRIVTDIGTPGQVTVNSTNASGVNIGPSTFVFQPGDHFSDTVVIDGSLAGAGLFLTGGRGTYNATDASGTFQELRGPINWRGHGASIGSHVVSDFRAAISGSTTTLSGFCLEGGTAGGGRVYFFRNTAGNTVITIPNIGAGDTFAFTGTAQTLLAKTLSGAGNIVMDGTTANMVFQNGGFGDCLVHDFTGVTTLRVSTHPNFDYKTVGSARTTGSFIDLTGQGASIGSTTLLSTPAAGVYRVSVYHVCTTAGAAGTLDTTISWNDGTAARTRTPAPQILLTATNFDEGEITIRVDGATNIAFTTTYAGAVGAPAYSLYIRVEAL